MDLINKLIAEYPCLLFVEDDCFAWSFEKSTIFYKGLSTDVSENRLKNKLLHELSHALLEHREFKSDLDLLGKEAEAWSKTKLLCRKYNVEFDKLDAEKSMGSYRSWAASRSECTNLECKKTGLQIAKASFICPSCNNQWKVGSSRFKRTYRH